MPNFPPPPTYADPVVVDETTRQAQFNPIWLKWFLDLSGFVTINGGGGLILHNSLGALQGGTAGEYYHLTASQQGALTAGFTGSGLLVRQTSPALITPDIGTPSAGVLSNCTGLPISTGVSGLGTGVATFLATPSSANLAAAVTDETGTGPLVFGTAPTLSNATLSGGQANSFNYVNYDTTPTLPGTILEGTQYWDDGSGSLQVLLKGGNVTYIDGQQEYALCYNDSGVTLTKGQVVYISGAQGNRIAVKRAQANNDANSAHTIGFVAESIAVGAEGWVQSNGPFYRINTFGTIAGETVYLSPTIPGAWTTTKPIAPEHLVILGFIERVHASVGSIYIKVDNGYELEELHNVRITSVQPNDLLQYDSAGPYWKNVAPSSIVAGTATNLAGGAAGSVPYQSGVGTTTFLGIGTADQVLAVNAGGTSPEWDSTTGTGNVVRATSPVITTPDINGGTADDLISVSASSGFFAHANTLTGNYTFPNSHNALSLGPITFQNGSSVTVGTNCRWMIL